MRPPRRQKSQRVVASLIVVCLPGSLGVASLSRAAGVRTLAARLTNQRSGPKVVRRWQSHDGQSAHIINVGGPG